MKRTASMIDKELAQQRAFEIFLECDEALYAGEFDRIDSRLATIDVSTLSISECRSWCVAASWARDRLSNYPDFARKCHDRAIELKCEMKADRLFWFTIASEQQ